MTTDGRIRVGVVGASPRRGFASLSHMPALQALPAFEIVAVCTSRQETADASAKHYNVPLAFADADALARHPDVDLVTVSVNVPDHYAPTMAAIRAGKAVYCEWPLGCDTAQATEMRDAATSAGIVNCVGLQGEMAPAMNYVRDLLRDGYVGRVLAVTMLGSAPSWGGTVESAYQASVASGANILTITCGHQLDALCYCLGEFGELSGVLVNQRPQIGITGTSTIIAKDTADQVVVNGIIGDGIAVAFQMRAGPARGTEFLFEIHGDEGDLVVGPSTSRASMQRQELVVRGGRGPDTALADLPVPDKYRWVPQGVPAGSAYNVAQLYMRLADAMHGRKSAYPDFAAAVTRHRMLDAIARASATGNRQRLG